MASEDLIPGDPVWAKMKGYPIWPAKIVDPPSIPKSSKHKKASYVLCFGTGEYAWIPNQNIIPHSGSILAEARSRKKPPTNYTNGIDELVSYFKTYKRVKQPKITKKEIIKNNITKSSPVKVAKSLNSVSNKYNRRELSKSLMKKGKAQRKRPLCDFNGKSSPPKFPKIKNISPTNSSPLNDFNSSFLPNNSMYKQSNYVNPCRKKLGFIGLGTMGRKIVKKLLDTGHDLTLWNKTLSECDIFADMGAKKVSSPAELVMECDIMMCCVSNPDASKDVFFGDHGVFCGLERAKILGLTGKGYIEMSNIDHATSQKISEAVSWNCGEYLESPIIGSSKEAEEGKLLVLAAGDIKLFREYSTFLPFIANNALYLSCSVGEASKMSLIFSTLTGTTCAALAEAMVMTERLNIEKSDLLTCLQYGPLACSGIMDIAQNMNNVTFPKKTALKHVQKDIQLTMSMSDASSQPLILASAANEIFKSGKRRFYSNEDMSAVYNVVKY